MSKGTQIKVPAISLGSKLTARAVIIISSPVLLPKGAGGTCCSLSATLRALAVASGGKFFLHTPCDSLCVVL